LVKKTKPEIQIGTRKIGAEYLPIIIAEIGINHEGDINKAKQMVHDAHNSGAECVKFQYHILEEEMIKTDIKPGNANETIWDIMERTLITHEEHKELKKLVEDLGMIYLCTPFSKNAADTLNEMGVIAFKIGSGECNNYPLVKYIASLGKPIILSTGMNNLDSIKKAISIIKEHDVDYAILHCTSLYPTPYNAVRLGALNILKQNFPTTVIGLSDHSIGNYTSFAAVALGASIIEKHFTSDKNWPGPDIEISIDPNELKELIFGANAIHGALGGKKNILNEEKVTINFAYASVVSIKKIKKGENFTRENIWVKRPGDGEILAEEYEDIIGKAARIDIKKDAQIRRSWIE